MCVGMGLSHTGLANVMRIPATKSSGGFDCCANSTNFDGTNDDLRRTTQFSNMADSRYMLFYINFAATGTLNNKILMTLSSGGFNSAVTIGFDASGRLYCTLTPGAASPSFTFRTNTPFLATVPIQYFNILIYADTNQAAGSKIGKIYVNDTADAVVTGDAGAAFLIDYTQTRWTLGIAANLTGNRLPFSVSALYWHPGVNQDPDTEANRRFYYNTDRSPVCELFTSNNGTWASGSQPIVYLRDAFSTFATNYGSGGSITTTGALTGDNSPCDTTLGLPIPPEA